MTATTCAPAFFKALNSRQNNCLRPDPQGPILSTRGGYPPLGQGHYRTTAGLLSGSGCGSEFSGAKSTAYEICYRTTAKTPRTRMRARARLRMHGIIHFFGSAVVVTPKSLAQNAKSHYRSHYRAHYRCCLNGSGLPKPLNSLKKGGI